MYILYLMSDFKLLKDNHYYVLSRRSLRKISGWPILERYGISQEEMPNGTNIK